MSFDEFVAMGVEAGSSVGQLPGEPAPGTEPAEPAALSVSEAVLLAKEQVARIPQLVVLGEVTGFRGPNARSGHCYFQLKDEDAAMDVTMWRHEYQRLGFEFKNGLKVQLTGAFQVYDKRGSLSFHASSATVAGEGLLRQQVAELARRLEREGLMDEARKRPIPRFCERVCVVTSLSGAVIDDVRRTLARRNPLVELQEVGCMVQGEGAAATIIRALGVAAAARPDAILLVRGGGSFEDLMTFNDEALARAVATCPVPVICGIGHEPDTSICDMVADRRCSTPTAAAESVAPAIDELANLTEERRGRMARALAAMVSARRQQVEAGAASAGRALRVQLSRQVQQVEALASRRCLQDPANIVRDRRNSLELTAERLLDTLPRTLEREGEGLASAGLRLHAAVPRSLAREGEGLSRAAVRLSDAGGRLLRPYEQRLARSAATLDALSPLRVLARGYSVVRDGEGHVVSRADGLAVGERVSLLLAEGTAQATITDVSTRAEGVGEQVLLSSQPEGRSAGVGSPPTRQAGGLTAPRPQRSGRDDMES